MECYRIPTSPLPLLLPKESVADVLSDAPIEPFSEHRASWMKGHVIWNNQRLPIMSYAHLHNLDLQDENPAHPTLAVLNPVPDAVRKAYSCLVSDGPMELLEIDESIMSVDLPSGLDRRYIEAVVRWQEQDYIVPRLNALAVAFSYF